MGGRDGNEDLLRRRIAWKQRRDDSSRLMFVLFASLIFPTHKRNIAYGDAFTLVKYADDIALVARLKRDSSDAQYHCHSNTP